LTVGQAVKITPYCSASSRTGKRLPTLPAPAVPTSRARWPGVLLEPILASW